MKDTNQNQIERALSMYTENVPSKDGLKMILSQLPEQKKGNVGRAVRSPYIWLAITEMVTLCFIMLAAYPSYTHSEYTQNPFYAVDQQVNDFEASIVNEDYRMEAADTNL